METIDGEAARKTVHVEKVAGDVTDIDGSRKTHVTSGRIRWSKAVCAPGDSDVSVWVSCRALARANPFGVSCPAVPWCLLRRAVRSLSRIPYPHPTTLRRIRPTKLGGKGTCCVCVCSVVIVGRCVGEYTRRLR